MKAKKSVKKKTTTKKSVRPAKARGRAAAKKTSGARRLSAKLSVKPSPRPAVKSRSANPAKKKAQKSYGRASGVPFRKEESLADSAGQSGDLQGLSGRELADSESVDELIDEGNAFEAEAVMGVEEADNADEQEVHTHEVPEDDVPSEYTDEE